MPRHVSIFKGLAYTVIVLAFSCVRLPHNVESGYFTFIVADVGQGLSQIGIKDSKAVIWDMGPPSGFAGWQDAYAESGSPFISAIIVSHGDLDHKGGLSLLHDSVSFSGLVITSPYEDTASLRAFSNRWSEKIRFRTVEQGDTIGSLDNVYIECLWPPDSINQSSLPLSGKDRNRFSLCFRVEFGNSSVLITSDIDTTAEKELIDMFGYGLRSDIVVVPHHGSRGSLSAVFYGYVNPWVAVISCGEDNPYGHPSDYVVKVLGFQMSVQVLDTRYDGNVILGSNGEYWTGNP